VPVVALPPVALLSLPHPDKISEAVARTLSPAPNPLSFNSIPLNGTDEKMIGAAVAARRAVSLAAMKLTVTRLTLGEILSAIDARGLSQRGRCHTVTRV
jgi:hypothetical protein